MYRYNCGNVLHLFRSYFEQNYEHHTNDTRISHHLYLPKLKKDIAKTGISTVAPCGHSVNIF